MSDWQTVFGIICLTVASMAIGWVWGFSSGAKWVLADKRGER